jgi:aminoglycoside phosphotransferase family enzyme
MRQTHRWQPGSAATPIPDPATRVRFLGSASAHVRHGGSSQPVDTIETHMSWVFLVGTQVLKLKKAVRYAFLDFSTPGAREAACREEVRLNARLAPDVYRGLMVLQWHAGALSVVPEDQADPQAATLDWLVWMRRLPAERMLDRAIADCVLRAQEIDGLADVLSAFYRNATVVPIDAAQYTLRFQREQAISRDVLLRPQFQLDGASEALDSLDAALERAADLLAERSRAHRIVDGHGDLRPEHVCLLLPPVVIDCLEFNARLRQVDPLDELAFLALECELAGAPWVGPRLRDRCGAALHDTAPPALWMLYTAYRALLRARLAMAHLLDPQPRTPQRWTPMAQRYVARALQALRGADAQRALSRDTARSSR